MASQSYFRLPFSVFQAPFYLLRQFVSQPVSWLLFFGAPAFNLFRMDVLTQQVIYGGQAYPMRPDTLMWLPIGFFAGVILLALITAFMGRLFCGWLCPHGTLSEWTRPIRRWVGIERKSRWLSTLESKHLAFKLLGPLLAILLGGALTVILGLGLIGYFVPYPELTRLYAAGGTSSTLMVVSLGMLMLLSMFLLLAGHHFCRYACPYGMLQGTTAYLTGKFRPMEVRMKAGKSPSNCGGCQGCQSACPVDLDPREFQPSGGAKLGFFDGCFNCGICLDACNKLHPGQGFLRFSWPLSGES